MLKVPAVTLLSCSKSLRRQWCAGKRTWWFVRPMIKLSWQSIPAAQKASFKSCSCRMMMLVISRAVSSSWTMQSRDSWQETQATVPNLSRILWCFSVSHYKKGGTKSREVKQTPNSEQSSDLLSLDQSGDDLWPQHSLQALIRKDAQLVLDD